LLTACNTVPQIPENLEPKEYFLLAQEAVVERNDYRAARTYYEAFLDRHSENIQLATEAEYEIAFIQFKLGDTTTAQEGFEALIVKYDSDVGELLPRWPLTLSIQMLERIFESVAVAPATEEE
jgi:hypothetical protein